MLVIGRHTILVSPFSAAQQYPKAKRFNCHIPSCGISSSDSYRLKGKKYLQYCTRCKKENYRLILQQNAKSLRFLISHIRNDNNKRHQQNTLRYDFMV